MRTQWCREHIDQTAEECGLAPSTVAEVKQAAKFCDEHSDFSELPTKPIIALIRVQDEQVREGAILKCKERLNGKWGAGRGNTKELTENAVKKIIETEELKYRAELLLRLRKEQENSTIPKITQEEVDEEIRAAPEPSTLIINTVAQWELDLCFEVIRKLRCGEDIPKYTKRVTMMIENGTLRIVTVEKNCEGNV